MRTGERLLIASLLFASVAVTLAAPSGVESWLRQSFDASGVPGMVAVVTSGGEDVIAAYGRDGRGQPMSARSLLRVASLTKTVTAVAVHQLAEQGRIGLDDPVIRYLPAFRLADARYTRITVQHLLDNRSGLRDGRLDLSALNRSASLQDYVAGLQHASLASDPGAARAYCNANWEILARLVEVVTGILYDEHLRSSLFAPLQMTQSTVAVANVDPPGGYQEIFGFHVRRADHVLFSASSGSNGLVTTAGDLLQWTRWLATGEPGGILRPATRARLIARALEARTTDGFEASGDRLGKSGMQMTEMSHLLIDPARGTGAAVVVNTSDMHGSAFAIASGALDVIEGRARAPLGHTARFTNVGYAAALILAAWLGGRGVRRAGRWAVRRRDVGRAGTLGRLVWLPLLTVPVIGLPQIVGMLTLGTRTISWTQITYLLLTPLVVLVGVAGAGLAVFVARLRAYQSDRLDTHARRE